MVFNVFFGIFDCVAFEEVKKAMDGVIKFVAVNDFFNVFNVFCENYEK